MKYSLCIRVIAIIIALSCLLLCLFSCEKKISNDGNDSKDSKDSNEYTDSGVASDTSVTEEQNDDAPVLTLNEIYKKLKPSIVKVLCYDFDRKTLVSQGSGFFIDKDGTFITNAHVLDGCYYVKIQTYFGTVYDVDVMYEYNDLESDYAICGIEVEYSSQPVEFASSASVGDKVYALGYPNDAYVMGAEQGKILSADAVQGTRRYYTNTAIIDHGSSGGALVDSRGRVIGITTGVASENEYVALKYDEFKDDVNKKHSGGKEPARYFHSVRDYNFSQGTMMLYFNPFANIISESDTSLDFTVGARLKDELLTEKVVLNESELVTITVTLAVTYDYYEVIDDTTMHQTKVIDETVYLNFDSLAELQKGKSMPVTISALEWFPENYYGMNISYDATFWVLQNGSISIYS